MWEDMWPFKRKVEEADRWLSRSELYDLRHHIQGMINSSHPLIDKEFLEKVFRALQEIEDCRSLIITLSQTHIAAKMAHKYEEAEKKDV